MLEERTDLGAANTLTLVRGNLPVLGRRLGPWLGVLAIATDLADGRLARRTGTTTPFGGYADAVADATFWTWFSHTYETDPTMRAAATLAWPAPVLLVTTLSLRGGRMVDTPRPRWLRPAAALQVLVAWRALHRRAGVRCRTRSTGVV